jgi:hypothetical protein
MASFDLNPTFTPLKTPFRSSYGVVLRCFLLFFIVRGHSWVVFRCLPIVYGVDGPLTMD